MSTRNVKKSLVTLEDIAIGEGSVSQERQGKTLTLSKVPLEFAFSSIADLPAVTVGRRISTAGYHAGTTVGGISDGIGVASARHDGVIYHDPDRKAEMGTAAYYVDSGVDVPCWERLAAYPVTVTQAGAYSDGPVNAEAFQAAAAASIDSIVIVDIVDDDTALPANYEDVEFVYIAETKLRNTHTTFISGVAKQAIKTQFPANHANEQWSIKHLRGQSQGSGTNGPSHADYGFTVSMHKKGYAGTVSPPNGEIDGISVFVRQDGPKGLPAGDLGSSDATGVLVNIQNVEDCGFTSAWEASTSNYDRGTSSITNSIQTQIGAIDANQVGKPTYGYVAVTTEGANTYAYYAGEYGASTWDYLFYSPGSFGIDGLGNIAKPTPSWSAGAWRIIRGEGANDSTQITHRGNGALFLFAQDAGVIQFGTNGAIRSEIDTAGNYRPTTNLQGQVGTTSRRFSEVATSQVNVGTNSSNGVIWTSGIGSPEGVVTANIGSMYSRTDGGAGTALYVKESGTGNTGWVAK